MSVSKLDINEDWSFGGSRNDYLNEEAEINQNILTRLRMFARDWFLDEEYGIDWLSLLTNKQTDQQILNAIRETLDDIDLIEGVQKLEFEKTGRSAIIRYSVITSYNTIFESSTVVEA